MQNKYNNETVISVTGPIKGQYLTLTLPWDANAEEWVDVFKTILTHQTFAPKTIAEIFCDDNCPCEEPDCSDEELEIDCYDFSSIEGIRKMINKECDSCDCYDPTSYKYEN